MRSLGTESWCFESKDSGRLDIALFVRDAVQLDVPDSPRMPPRLGSTVPDRTSLLTPELRALAAEAWTAWWDVLVADGSWPYGFDSTPILVEWEPAEDSVLRRPSTG